MAAANTTYDMGNGDLVRDQHERGTLNVETVEGGDDKIEKHTCVLETAFFDAKSDFHEDNFEEKFDGRLYRNQAPLATERYRTDRVVVVRDEYAAGDIQIYPLSHVPSFVSSNRYTILHAPDSFEGVDEHVNTVKAENARSD
jgi:hypothetical protein